MISIIVAVAKNRAIGRDNQLLWHLSEDLKYFKRVTSGHTVIMGSKTYESIGRPLPNRLNIVVSRKIEEPYTDEKGVEYHNSLEKVLAKYKEVEEEVFVIGGGNIYASSLEAADRLYLTEVDLTVEDADTFFPEIDETKWIEVERSDVQVDEKSGTGFYFRTLERRNN